ncbi:MAG TPA: hypothetical protein VMV46_17255 [Thermoanaerobaculia bacterium]|nr:hypothetical protein [Thermoanaerobaculia bacterium]
MDERLSRAALALPSLAIVALVAVACTTPADAPGGRSSSASFAVTFGADTAAGPFDGRLLLIVARNETPEPRFQASPGLGGAQIFGIDVEGWDPGEAAIVDGSVFGFPYEGLADLPPGEYWVQALLHVYDTFERAVGPAVELPMDQGEGQNWRRSPGNLYSTPRLVRFDPEQRAAIEVALDRVIPPIEPPADTEYVRHVEIRSELLSEFWGRDMHLGAHVLVPHGFDQHPEARYPLMVFHGHFPAEFGGFRTEPPDPDLACEYSQRFQVDCYNRIQQQEAYAFYQRWISPDFPRYLVIEIQHQNPYYDDSYAVNSANLGPYGDAIMRELVPSVEEQFRGIGEGWARFTYGGSTGGWEALAAQVFYPDDFNGTFAACPDPIDFRAYTLVNIYEQENAYFRQGAFKTVEIPGHRNWLGEVDITVRDYNHYELVLGENGRSGDQWDIWQAVYSPMGEDGYPQPIWDKRTGEIDPEVASHWRENYDLRHIMERDWATLGPKLAGKIHIYCGDMDNYYLNNAVYLTEAFLESTIDPYYAGEVDYGDRAEHCWNGDHENGNHISRLRYNTMYLPKILARIATSAPPGADLTSWRH